MFGLEHFFMNCHGERDLMLVMLFGGIPTIGVYVRGWAARRRLRREQEQNEPAGCPCGHDEGEEHA